MTITYPALCHYEDGGYWCEFPDLKNCFSQGDSVQDILENAREAMEGYIEVELEEHNTLPAPSLITDLKAEGKDFLTYISCELPQGAKSVKKTLTIPDWLNRRAEKAGVNFSRTLQDALLQKLGISPAV